MKQPLFRPSVLQIAVLALSAACALGFAVVVRYLAIENSPMALACDAGASGWMCGSRKVMLIFSQSGAFGAVGLVAALLSLLRPSIALSTVALVSASFGLVLYNTSPSAVAVACLALSLARPLPEPE